MPSLARIRLRVGPALEAPLKAAPEFWPFDLVFIDAAKPGNPYHLAWTPRLARPGTVLFGDNVV